MQLRCLCHAPQRKKGDEIQDGRWPVELGSRPKTANLTVSRPATSPHDLLIAGASTKTENHAEGGRSHGPELLPWGAFLPVEENGGSWSGRRGAQAGDCNELLDEGKKQLEKEEKEGQLKEQAEAVGHVGGGALDDLLADLHEPSFSRQENERLRRGIATRLRAKVARLFGRVMCEYFSGSEPNRRSAEDGMAIATAAFRVKLNRLLDQSRLGEIQAQVTREISGITKVPAPRVRRECCMNTVHSQAKETDEKNPRGVLDIKLRSTSAVARLHATAARLVAKPPCTVKKNSVPIPVIENVDAGSRQERINWEQPSPDSGGQIPQRDSDGAGIGVEGGGDSCPSSSCSNADAMDLRRSSNGKSGAAAALGILHSLNKGGSCNSRDGTSKGGFTDGSCSGDESVDKNDETLGEVSEQAAPDWSSSDSDDDWLFTEENAEPPPRPAGLHGENTKYEARYDESLPHATILEETDQTLLRREAPKRHFRHRGSRQHRRSSRRRGGETAGAADRDIVNHDESWSNKSLTVLFKELGLHQSCQRAVLSKHVPATCKGDEDGGLQPEPPPLPRIDRPHFRPTFVELTAAGKGSTLMMCPEPVAPGYEYSDVFEEAVKLHPPVGQLILEDIERRKIVTRGDAIAHVENLERGSDSTQAKVLVDDFLSGADVKNFLASAETLELDLAQCAMEGTLFNDDDVQ